MSAAPRATGRPLLLGHRGAPSLAPENTLAGFEAALHAGLDGLELDLQRTSDGVLAVVHDPLLEGLPIPEMPWGELQERAPSVPRLEQVFELMDAHPDRCLNIELKTPAPARDRREETLAERLRDWRGTAKDRTWISTFDPISLVRLDALQVDVPLALLVSREPELALLPCLPVAGVHPSHRLVDAERMRAWREADLFVHVWTINDRDTADRVLAHEPDGLIGDVPELLLAAREERS